MWCPVVGAFEAVVAALAVNVAVKSAMHVLGFPFSHLGWSSICLSSD